MDQAKPYPWPHIAKPNLMGFPTDTGLESEKPTLVVEMALGVVGCLSWASMEHITGCASRPPSPMLSHILAKAQQQAKSRDHTASAAVTQRAPPHFIFNSTEPYKYSNDRPIPSILPTPPALVLAHCRGGGVEGRLLSRSEADITWVLDPQPPISVFPWRAVCTCSLPSITEQNITAGFCCFVFLLFFCLRPRVHDWVCATGPSLQHLLEERLGLQDGDLWLTDI